MPLLQNVLPGGNPWTGGSLKRVTPPTGSLGSGIAGARNGAGSLLDGVAASETKRARYNSGSNIRVPYGRVVPVSDNKLPTTTSTTDDPEDVVGETDDLRPMQVAFIRGAGISEHNELVERTGGLALRGADGGEVSAYSGDYRGLSGAMLRVGNGVDRPHRLCTFEYAKRFLQVSLGNATFEAPANLVAGKDAFLHSADGTDRKKAMSDLQEGLRAAGVFLWTPDGVIVARDHTGSEPDWESIFDTKHGQLFNVAVQGPAVVSTFTGDRRLVSMPGERLFVLVTCDVLARRPTAVEQTFDGKKAYMGRTEAYSHAGRAYFEDQIARIRGVPGLTPRLCNFQLRLSSASEMWKHSGAHTGSNRLGLSLCSREAADAAAAAAAAGVAPDVDCVRRTYVVGGWSLGRVLDSAASRPYTGLYQQKKDLTGHAANLNVCVQWMTCDELRAAYCPKNGPAATRGQQ